MINIIILQFILIIIFYQELLITIDRKLDKLLSKFQKAGTLVGAESLAVKGEKSNSSHEYMVRSWISAALLVHFQLSLCKKYYYSALEFFFLQLLNIIINNTFTKIR